MALPPSQAQALASLYARYQRQDAGVSAEWKALFDALDDDAGTWLSSLAQPAGPLAARAPASSDARAAALDSMRAE